MGSLLDSESKNCHGTPIVLHKVLKTNFISIVEKK